MTSATSSGFRHDRRGVALCLLSAVGFGLMAVFAKEAYAAGAGVTTLLAVRFTLAAGAFWAIVALRPSIMGAPRPSLPAPRIVVGGLALGAVGYAVQAAGYFGALARMDASLTSLLLYTYPALVFAAAVALRRERADARRLSALAVASAGVALVLVGGSAGALDPVGVALALGAAVAYTIYILVTDRIVERIDPFVLGALVTTGAAVSTTGAALVGGRLDLGFGYAGLGWIVALTLVSTVGALTAFTLGLRRVGPATAAIVSTIEPVVTVTTAMALFGERLGALQGAGGALVLGAVLVLATPTRVRSDVAATELAAVAPARALAHEPAHG